MGKSARAIVDEADAYSVEEFCSRNSISVQTFYKFLDIMPETFVIGSRRLISREAGVRWRRAREIATACDETEGDPPSPGDLV